MNLLTRLLPRHSRRDILKSAALALLPLSIKSANDPLHDQGPMTANGGNDPYPIPWLDKNGSHNQPAGANLAIPSKPSKNSHPTPHSLLSSCPKLSASVPTGPL
jgi:hypothetical protein